MALLSAVQWVSSLGVLIVSLQNEGFPMFCLCLITWRHLGLQRKVTWISEFTKQTFVHELLEQCCNGLFAIVAVVCSIWKSIQQKALSQQKRMTSVVKEWASRYVSSLTIAQYVDDVHLRCNASMPVTKNCYTVCRSIAQACLAV